MGGGEEEGAFSLFQFSFFSCFCTLAARVPGASGNFKSINDCTLAARVPGASGNFKSINEYTLAEASGQKQNTKTIVWQLNCLLPIGFAIGFGGGPTLEGSCKDSVGIHMWCASVLYAVAHSS